MAKLPVINFTNLFKNLGKQASLLSSRLEFTGLKAVLASAGVGVLSAQFTNLFDSIKSSWYIRG